MTSVTRRGFVSTAALGGGAALLAPILDSLKAQAGGKLPPTARRVVFVVESNGLFPHHVQPKTLERPKGGATRLIDESLKAHDLHESIAALTPYKDRLTILQGLSGRICDGSGGHSTNYGGLGFYGGNVGPIGQTVDAALAEVFSGPIPHVGLGLHNNFDTAVQYTVSATAPGKPLPISCKPDQAFKSLFGSALGDTARQEFDLQTNLLDFMADDVKAARHSLAGPEREKLDKYLESFESLKDRQVKIAGIGDALRKHAPPADKFTSKAETDRLEGHFDLAAAALIAGLTNVVTLTSGGGGQQYISYAGLGLPINGHGLGHGVGVNGKTPEECRVIIRQFHCKLIARLADKLKAVPEGDGTVLDNTLIVYLSDSGEAHHPNLLEWPVILLGNLGGKLKAGNRLLEYPKYGVKGHKTMANLYLALLQAAGKPRDKFGVADPKLADIDTKGPLAELIV